MNYNFQQLKIELDRINGTTHAGSSESIKGRRETATANIAALTDKLSIANETLKRAENAKIEAEKMAKGRRTSRGRISKEVLDANIAVDNSTADIKEISRETEENQTLLDSTELFLNPGAYHVPSPIVAPSNRVGDLRVQVAQAARDARAAQAAQAARDAQAAQATHTQRGLFPMTSIEEEEAKKVAEQKKRCISRDGDDSGSECSSRTLGSSSPRSKDSETDSNSSMNNFIDDDTQPGAMIQPGTMILPLIHGSKENPHVLKSKQKKQENQTNFPPLGGGTRRKRRPHKPKRTRRVRKSKSKAKRTRKARKRTRRKRTRRRSKK